MLSSLQPLFGGGFLPAFAQICSFYFITGGVLQWLVPSLLPVQGIQTSPRKPHVLSRDAIYSIGPLAVKAGIWTIVEWLHANGWTRLYSSPINTWTHVLYCVFVVAVLDVLHDTWFYWTHRLLHWNPLYRHVHYIHHKSNVPCAFTGYSFHVVEAVIVFANEILVCWMLPMHTGLHRVYHILTTAIHEGGHVGYEIAPYIPSLASLAAVLLFGTKEPVSALNTVQHHDMHHRIPNKHFSLYFTHWDRWCNTLHPAYEGGLFWYHDKASKSQQQQPGSPSQGSDAGSVLSEQRSEDSSTLDNAVHAKTL